MKSASMAEPTPRRSRMPMGCLLAAGFALVLLVGVFYCFSGVFFVHLWLHQNPGSFDRAKMEAVVAQVRLAKLQPGEEKEFQLDDPSDPKSLRLYPKRGADGEMLESEIFRSRVGRVSVHLSLKGQLFVLIETNDMGHAGTYGFYYSESPLSSKVVDFDDWNAEGKIDDHWEKVGFHMD